MKTYLKLGLCLTIFLSGSTLAAPENVKQDALQILQKLVSYRSTAGSGQIKPMAEYLREKFHAR
jgi:hypothetical protein